MKYIIGKDRNQFEMFCLEERIEKDNEVRMIELFVDSLTLADYGFVEQKANPQGGRPAYHPSALLKLFIYGYMNRIRSSRQLEKECYRNLEVMWLMRELAPDHNTISNFRRDNPDAIKKVFRATVELAKNFELIGGKLLAGDGSVFRAQNSKKKNYNQKKIDRQRQAIVEHPFGTIKRQWGFDHIMTKKTIKRASADIGLVFVLITYVESSIF